jgi:hypothetical protein
MKLDGEALDADALLSDALNFVQQLAIGWADGFVGVGSAGSDHNVGQFSRGMDPRQVVFLLRELRRGDT